MRKHIFFLLIPLVFGCTHHESNSAEKAQLIKNMPIRDKLDAFALSLPAGWTRVETVDEIDNRVLWAFTSGYGPWTDNPDFAAWDGPENSDSFITCMRLKRDRTIGVSFWFDYLIPQMKDFGATVEEKGSTSIDGLNVKWWIQSFGTGILQQKCYMVGYEEYVYFLSFTTRYLSDERLKEFDNIIKTVTFSS
jgi:hypothetical protein